jgi:hypothetical protein
MQSSDANRAARMRELVLLPSLLCMFTNSLIESILRRGGFEARPDRQAKP